MGELYSHRYLEGKAYAKETLNDARRLVAIEEPELDHVKTVA
jgi:hypothetical protein